MDDLDRQLAKLALMNKVDLRITPVGGSPGKKTGPAVPPKPKKTQPQIPQSYPLKKPVEPSYSSRLQPGTQLYSNIQPKSPQTHYSNAPTLPLNSRYVEQRSDNNYANVPKYMDQNMQYVNLPRSASAMSGTSSISRQGNYGSTIQQPNDYGSQSRTSVGPKGYTKSENVTYSNIQMPPSRNQDGLIYSNLVHPPRDGANVYSNLPPSNSAYCSGDDLPPPPPPLDITAGLSDYAPCSVNTNLPPPPKDLLPPPSPVSSSYSELRRATQPGQDFHNYSIESQYGDSDSLYGFGDISQASSTYESIYEPINPRPPSQMSSRSNYSLYAPYVSGNSSTATGPSQSVSRLGHNKEQEVDSLTDLLVQGMRGGEESDLDQEDVFGLCVKCGEKIVGENSGCTAMDKLYHTKCFTCHHCAINLQGKPFYALNGKPYCEEDYLNTLEKCCVCQNPILDRILRATGKPYHPKCFCCVVCGKSLDGIPFTVDASNRVHCIEDFHKIFAPKCWVCKQPIMPEPGEEETVRVVALDHSFHVQCYKCEDCGLVLSSEAEGRGCYPLDGHILCKSCNAKRVQALTNHMTTEL
ncbi:thyroid receptor-interacting protein 6 isoform X1 [Diorhabda carinulata]|uniref:thyroid receptor-interacting protein 6 isoform X1 n=1 Tax=Diorhabda carinulata TaxID=1163345 RepID=UPI0025A1B730|nr:thyroid receptor-interacting protein 6 isoform X1 [Diorhabda carinulata]XP_057664785.1 thyroid receptor-interacting protein 6 isoform X1 [Diorhabda carinulata]XP_057664786.1 thyroid receptor-interacting protein 6 isoform X1 [Diorhabda carinulata]XP_057664787.1 thyroid receptor-interacting protein 6 isoform X1 [Diorhabda carinulata]XP_057664788.1 thyroid receptor-interacting protein 6 isoform X1 [Diorhabda carinulata]